MRSVWLKGTRRGDANERLQRQGGNLRRMLGKKHRIRCLSVLDLEDVQYIEEEFFAGSLVLFSMKEIGIQGHHVLKRFLQQVNALAREYHYQLIRFSREFIMGIPLDTHELVTDPRREEKD